MSRDEIVFRTIGVVHSPFCSKTGVPIQPAYAGPEAKGSIEVFHDFEEGLADLDGFSHIVVIYCFHKSSGYALRTKPFLGDRERGVFATRAPRRPNPIGVSVLPLQAIEGNFVHVAKVDILEGTPVLDLKPYVPLFEEYRDIKIGWLEGQVDKRGNIYSDDRFCE